MDEVGKAANLERRGAVYRCRMRCPQHLLRDGVPLEKSVSLRTKERSVALERLPAARLQMMEFFQRGSAKVAGGASGIAPRFVRARRPDHPDLPLLTVGEAETFARGFFRTAYAELDVATADLAEMSREQRYDWEFELEGRIGSLKNVLPDEEDPALGVEISLLRDAGRRAPYTSEPSRLLRGYLRRALAQLCRLELDRLGGDFRDCVTDRMFAADPTVWPAPNGGTFRAANAQNGVTLEQCVDRFQAEDLNLRSVTPKTGLKHRALLQLVIGFFGRERLVADIRRADCTSFRDTIAKLPPNFTKLAPGEPIGGIAARHTGRTLAWETQSAYLKILERLLGWAATERLIQDNVALGLSPMKRREAAEEQRLSFTAAELTRIFSSPLYTGCVDDERGYNRAGPNVIKRSRYWLPLIALFTGMRMEEILQLTPSHVRTSIGGTPFLVLTRDMRLKTENAEREIPIHPQLVRSGFLTWADQRKLERCTRLFDDVPPSKHGYYSDTFSKRFRTFLRSIEIDNGRRPKLCFHSFRHTFKDALNESGAPEAEAEELGGWSRGKRTSRRYGNGLCADRLRPVVERINFGVALSDLP